MKKLLTIAMMTAAVSALAVESSNTFGILRVDSTDRETIVAVPWTAAGGGDINIKDVVKTANLTIGDDLYYYDGANFKMWELGANGWDIAQDDQGNKPTAELARGGAIILVRQHPEVGSFYLYGQYTSAGTSVAPTIGGKSLIAPPTTTEVFDLNGTGAMTGTPAAGDYIVVDLGTILNYDSSHGWCKKKTTFSNGGFTTSYNTDAAKIPAGKGVWYVSTGTSVPTFNF